MSQIDRHDHNNALGRRPELAIVPDKPPADDPIRSIERITLGKAMHSKANLDAVRDLIEPADFYEPRDQDLFRHLCLHVDSGGACDPEAIVHALINSGVRLRDHGYVAELWIAGGAGGTVEWYAQQVAEESRRRNLCELNARIGQHLRTGDYRKASEHAEQIRLIAESGRSSGFKPLPLDLPSHPGPFPVHALPPVMRNMVLAVAANKQVPRELPALFGLSAVATLAGPRLAIDQGRGKGWTEALCLYTVVGLESSELKSPTGRDVFGPLHRIQKSINAEHLERVEMEIARLNTERPAGALSVNPTARAESDKVESQIRELEESKKNGPRILAPGDTTPEKLADWMSTNGGSAAILDPEGTFLGILSGRYTNGKPNVEIALNGYDGDFCGAGRIGRNQDDIDRAILTFSFGTQPAVLQEIARNKIMVERGLLNRFLLAIPESMLGRRNPEGADYDFEAIEAWEKLLGQISRIEIPPPDARPFPALVLSREAGVEHVRFKAWVEPRMSADGEFGDISGWAGKHAGRVMRLAGLLHLAAGHGPDDQVSIETMNAAIEIGTWAIAHAVAILGVPDEGLGATDAQCSDVLAWIRKRRVRSFILRDAHRGVRAKWSKQGSSEVMADALERLVETRHLSVRSEEDGARRMRLVYEVNQAVFSVE